MIVIVVGMHRSGTSALAGLVHRCGIPMGEGRVLKPRPSAENPRGFYENIRFRTVSDEILHESGYQVKSWAPVAPAIAAGPGTRRQIEQLLTTYTRRHGKWGWKDPRVCLTLGIWLDVVERLGWRDQIRVVHISRDAHAVAQSLVRRGDTSYETGLRLWTLYNERALRIIEDRRPATLFVTYEDLCRRRGETADRLFDFLDVSNGSRALAFVDERLDRRTADAPPTVDVAVQRAMEQIASRLRRLGAAAVDAEVDASSGEGTSAPASR